MSGGLHGPDPTSWFARGVWPRCKCGFDPHDNGALSAHWREHGFEVVDHHGQLIRRAAGWPLGAASGGDVGFWDRLGTDDVGMPAHLPMGLNERGQGPEGDSAAYTYVCWCGDAECPLTLALGHAWASGRRTTRRTVAEAWDDGYDAGHQDARAVQPTYPEPTRNPYRTTQAGAEAPGS